MKLSLAASLAFLLFVSCSRKEPSPEVEALRFPVVMLFGNASTRVCKDRAELTNMHTNFLTLNNEPPLLIDSKFKIYSLDHFQSVHGGLWLMANPSGMTEVTFELKTQNSGRENARALFVHQLEKQSWRDDLQTRRKTLAATPTLLEMAGVIQDAGR